MQHIGLNIVSENNEITERSQINFADIIGGALWRVQNYKTKYVWLNTIDPYGETWLNVCQTPIVVEELERLVLEQTTEISTKNLISQAIEFIRKIGTHQYIRFSGD